MTFTELKEQITEICPGASFEVNSKGQIIVVTSFYEQDDDDELADANELDNDFDFDFSDPYENDLGDIDG